MTKTGLSTGSCGASASGSSSLLGIIIRRLIDMGDATPDGVSVRSTMLHRLFFADDLQQSKSHCDSKDDNSQRNM